MAHCTAQAAGVDAWDAGGRVGLLHMAFPLKMLRQPDGHLTSCDLLHTVAGAIIFDVYENQDARLISLQIPDPLLRTFPGPAYGPAGLRARTGFGPDEPAFGTILKPTAGITADEVGHLVAEAAECPLFLFVKEDEDLYPNLDYSPVGERVARAVAAIERAKESRRGKGLIFAPHITGAPHEIAETLRAVIEAGASGVMLSETFAGGTDPHGPRGDEASPASAGDLWPQCRHRRQDSRRYLAGSDRSVGPPGRRRLPPNGPRSARAAVYSPLRRTNGRRPRRSCPASCRGSSRR